MSKQVIIDPFGVLKVTDEVIATISQNSKPTASNPFTFTKEIIKGIKQKKTAQFIGINPDKKEFFTFIPIVDGDELFASIFPDPIQLYFSLAYSSFEFSNQTRSNIIIQKNSKPFSFVNSYLYNWHLKYKINSVIFLHATVEAFINYLMPEDFIYTQVNEGKKSDRYLKETKDYNKEQTERFILFKEKLSKVVPQITKIDFQKSHQKIYDKLLNLNEIRNDLIHLRSKKEKNLNYFHSVFDNVINIDLEPYILAVKDFINSINPDFIKLVPVTRNDKVIIFNFTHYKAFKLDISVFIEVLLSKESQIRFIIPMSEEPDYKTFINWIMQNLDILAEKQIIYFTQLNNSSDGNLEFDIVKRADLIFHIEKNSTKSKLKKSKQK